jgi:hypothetical protein
MFHQSSRQLWFQCQPFLIHCCFTICHCIALSFHLFQSTNFWFITHTASYLVLHTHLHSDTSKLRLSCRNFALLFIAAVIPEAFHGFLVVFGCHMSWAALEHCRGWGRESQFSITGEACTGQGILPFSSPNSMVLQEQQHILWYYHKVSANIIHSWRQKHIQIEM